ncbi:hypothetical protein ADICYQ_1495 [Cyclobacterium qasimii M12-11B]|uniref:Uncharacterized protein n=1 Tax=Cyclobacterium qasimii M12-11B TaxID=641524 RepID=S7WZQ2_9BACT|nr:hypothetical protein ADICYQ_1495 [Cyclobacterium qasimii M12-11B]
MKPIIFQNNGLTHKVEKIGYHKIQNFRISLLSKSFEVTILNPDCVKGFP